MQAGLFFRTEDGAGSNLKNSKFRVKAIHELPLPVNQCSRFEEFKKAPIINIICDA